MTISQIIKQYREDKGYCQEYMCSQLGVSQSTYSRIERCDAACTKRLAAIANALGTVPDTLLTYSGSATPERMAATSPPEPLPETMRLDKDDLIRYQAEEITFLRKQISYLQAVWYEYCGGGGNNLMFSREERLIRFSEEIKIGYLAEAIQYRSLDRENWAG